MFLQLGTWKVRMGLKALNFGLCISSFGNQLPPANLGRSSSMARAFGVLNLSIYQSFLSFPRAVLTIASPAEPCLQGPAKEKCFQFGTGAGIFQETCIFQGRVSPSLPLTAS